jgi:hypothetical protein
MEHKLHTSSRLTTFWRNAKTHRQGKTFPCKIELRISVSRLKLALTSPISGGRSVGIVRACGLKPRSLFVCKSINNLRRLFCVASLGDVVTVIL